MCVHKYKYQEESDMKIEFLFSEIKDIEKLYRIDLVDNPFGGDECPSYTYIGKEYLENNPKKPFILCEYMHDMGNSLGGMESYIRLLDQYEDYQGGFIWDYIDQALFVKDEVTGRDVLRYGGDFDDRPSDYEFSGNGILFADRTEKPAMQEVRYYYGTQNRNR